jgi:hypothetical protein
MRTMDGSNAHEPLLPKASLDTCLKRGILRTSKIPAHNCSLFAALDHVPNGTSRRMKDAPKMSRMWR